MTFAFDYGNTLVERGDGRPWRFGPMQALYRAVHAAGHRVLIVTHIDPQGYPSVEDAINANNEFVTGSLRENGLPWPSEIIHVTDNKIPILQREKVDLFIDDLEQWTNAATSLGITSLRLL